MSFWGSLLSWFPIAFLAGISITRWTPYKKPDNWMYPVGSPDQRQTPEGKEYFRKAMRFWLLCICAVIVWYAAIGVIVRW